MTMKEVVLYYNPGNAPKPALMKSVLVRMGIRIKNVTNEQTGETIGSLLGMEQQGKPDEAGEQMDGAIEEQMLVLHQFTERRLDQLLFQLRKAGVPKIELKAIVTEQNSHWTLYQLYEELRKEREAFANKT
ncbi:MAG: DUF3783 domain-containing protein [Lachnospiraceae bacterium]|jgi:hypothetical protein